MSIVKLTVLERLNLEGVIRSQRCHVVSDAELFFAVKNKIFLPEVERKRYLIEVRPGEAQIDLNMARGAEEAQVELEGAEVTKLLERLEGFVREPGIAPDDVEWFVPLKQKLEAARANPSANGRKPK